MENQIVFSIFLTLAGMLIGYIISYLTAKNTIKEKQLSQLSTSDFLNQINFIVKFLKDEETKDVIKIFKNIQVKDLSKFISVNRSIEDSLKKFSIELGTISRLIEHQVFNEVNGKIHRYIEDNTKFIQRLDEAKNSKKYLARNILNVPMMESALQNRDIIFIESGSTFAYLILPLIEYVKKLENNGNGLSSFKDNPLTICTNNVIIYIILLFEEYFSPFLLPGKPTNQYAATFGDPKYTDRFNKEKTKQFFEEHKITTILSTASFLDISYGPHVSSHPNWQMKRFLNEYSMEKNCKNIFVITSEKINDHVDEESVDQSCKLIFSEEKGEPVSCKMLSDKDKEKVKNQFKTFLNSKYNYIITASTDKNIASNQTNKLHSNHEDKINKWSIELNDGILFLLYKKDTDILGRHS